MALDFFADRHGWVYLSTYRFGKVERLVDHGHPLRSYRITCGLGGCRCITKCSTLADTKAAHLEHMVAEHPKEVHRCHRSVGTDRGGRRHSSCQD